MRTAHLVSFANRRCAGEDLAAPADLATPAAPDAAIVGIVPVQLRFLVEHADVARRHQAFQREHDRLRVGIGGRLVHEPARVAGIVGCLGRHRDHGVDATLAQVVPGELPAPLEFLLRNPGDLAFVVGHDAIPPGGLKWQIIARDAPIKLFVA